MQSPAENSRRTPIVVGIVIAVLALAAIGLWTYGRMRSGRQLDEERTVAEAEERLRAEERRKERAVNVDRGFDALARGDTVSAVGVFEDLLERDPLDPEARLGLAVSLMDDGRTVEARAILRGLERSFEDPDRRQIVAQLWGELAEWRRMIGVISSAAEFHPDDIAPAVELAELADSEGDWQRVLDITEPLLELDLPAALRTELQETRARALVSAGRLDEAAGLYADVRSESNLRIRAELALRLNRLHQAEELYLQLAEREPENEAARKNLEALHALRTGSASESVEIVLSSLEPAWSATSVSEPGAGSGLSAASSFLGVSSSGSTEERRFHIQTDGLVFTYTTTVSDDPRRFVVDLHGLRHAAARQVMVADRPGVRRIRTSQYRAEPSPVVRVVFDLEDSLVATVQHMSGGLEIEFLESQPAVASSAVPQLAPSQTTARPALEMALVAESDWRVRQTLGQCLSVRESPDTNSERVECLLAGSGVVRLEDRGAWSRVMLRDGRKGWAMSRFLESGDSGEAEKDAGVPRVSELGPANWRVKRAVDTCLNVRPLPSAMRARIACLAAGEPVRLVETRDKWSRISTRDLADGWVASAFLESYELAEGAGEPIGSIAPGIAADSVPATPTETTSQDAEGAANSVPRQAVEPSADHVSTWRVSEAVSSCLNVRAGRALETERSACLEAGQRVQLLERADKWSLIATANGEQGWVMHQFLASEPREGRWEVGRRAAPCLAVRKEPDSEGRQFCLEPGAAVTMLDWGPDWSRVRLRSGSEGWVATRLLDSAQ